MLTKLSSLSTEEKRRGVISISAGNHAQALAYCAALERLDALIVMWQGASTQKIDATRAYGAEVDLEATGPAEAFERLGELMEETGRALVHPFDDPFTIAGQGTVGLEILEDVPDATVIVVPVGGGGLVSGIAVASEGRRVVAVEPERSDALHRGLEAGEPVPVTAGLDGGRAQRSLRRRACDQDLPGPRESRACSISEEELADGMRFLYGRAKLACEPAGAAAVAALLAGKVAVEPGDTVVCVVSGGNVVARNRLCYPGFR